MPKPVAKEYQAVLREHRQRLVRLGERRGVARLQPIYDQAIESVEHKLRRALGRLGEESFTAHQHRIVLSQLRQGQAMLESRLAGELGDISEEVQIEAIRGFAESVTKLEKRFRGAEIVLPIDEVGELSRLIDARRPDLDSMHQKALRAWGQDTFNVVHEQLSLSLAAGESATETMERIPEALAGEWYKGERIVRTEVAYAFGASSMDAAQESLEVLPDLMLRWNEHCDDDANPLDDRVAEDSIALHGQVATPGGWFIMPDDPDVPKSLIGKGWQFPPNRPNDRATLSPWREGWGIPGWQYSEGRRIDL
jgi:hypothetical protein